jgi:hypothetical protein
MIKLAWLEKMVATNQISTEAADRIYSRCDGIVKAASAQDLAKFKSSLRELGSHLGTIASVGAGMYLTDKTTTALSQRSDVSAMKETLEFLRNHPSLSHDKNKIDSRFREILQHAPGVIPNKEVTLGLVRSSLENGFSQTDIDNMQRLQAAAAGGVAKSFSGQADYASEVRNKFIKSASVLRPELVGTITFSQYVNAAPFIKEANKRKMSEIVKDTLGVGLGLAGVSYGLSALSGLVNMGVTKFEQKKFKKDLDRSFEEAYQGSQDENLKSSKENARQAFETLVHFSPHVAVEPRAARSFMEKMVAYRDQAVQPSDIKDLVDIERGYSQTHSGPSPFFNAFSQSAKLLGADKALSSAVDQAVKPHYEMYRDDTLSSAGYDNLRTGYKPPPTNREAAE